MKQILLGTLLLFSFIGSAANEKIRPDDLIIIENIETTISVFNCETCQVFINNEQVVIDNNEDGSFFKYVFQKESEIKILSSDGTSTTSIRPIPLWLSIVPPLLAIVLALLFKEVVTSLVIGIFSGAFIIHFYNSGFLSGLSGAFSSLIDHYILSSLNNEGHLSIIVFSLLIGGMVSIISKNGGMQGVVNRISKYAKSAKSGQLATWFLGIAIFFDDYANTLIVGNTMRPVTDRLKISREKLAYLVDSTAAPIAAIAFVTTWIGAELGYIESSISSIQGLNESVYSIFISSLAYSFYPIFALLFMLILILKEKDFGPMHKAESKARQSSKVLDTKSDSADIDEFEPVKGITPKSFNAIIPVLIVIIGTIIGLFLTGWNEDIWSDENMGVTRKLSTIIGNADSYKALLWSSLLGLSVAVILTVAQKILSLHQAIETSIRGFKTMFSAIIILVLAWALALVIEDLHTADLLTSFMSDSVSPYLLPTITFVLAALVAFSTGSSWGTMAILYPLMIPASWVISTSSGIGSEAVLSIFHNVVACVLAGSVLGDHCSPISDTTILSSLASSCNHIDHVKTQMPYALTVGVISILCGTLPSAFGVPFLITLPVGLIVIYFVINFFGKKVVTST